MNKTEAVTREGEEDIVDIPLPDSDVDVNDSFDFEVEEIRSAVGHFGDTFRRC